MAVIVDKAGGNGAAFGVDRAFRSAAQLTDVGDLAVLMPTSPRNAGIPEPSTISPFLISRSYAIAIPPPAESFRARV
jgi:hypothetical protein